MAFQQGTLLLWVSSAGWGGRGLLFLGLGSLFGWLLTLLLLSFPSISGSLGKWLVPCFVFLTVCELFIQAGFSGSEVFFGFCCLLVGFVISWGTLCCCLAFVTLKFSLLFVTSKWLLWLGASVAVS